MTAVRSIKALALLALASLACSARSNGPASAAPIDAAVPSDTGPSSAADAPAEAAPAAARAVKVLIVNMSVLEGTDFISGLKLTQTVPVKGISGGVLCNADDVCEVTLGMGYGNAATSMAALVYRGGLNLTQTYFIIAGTAGIDPTQGTIGSAAWAHYLVDFGIAAEIDAREMPSGWPYGYVGLGAASPSAAPTTSYGTEVFELDAALVQKAFSLSKGVTLQDSATAQAFRAHYPSAPANAPPTVLQCDVLSSDTWFGGTALTQRAHDWAVLLTGGKATSCMSANEDNATYEVLRRAGVAGKVDANRVAVLRAASDMNAPYEGLSDADSLEDFLSEGGLEPAVQNLYAASAPVIAAIVGGWAQWQAGVP